MHEKDFKEKYYKRVQEQTLESLPSFIEEMLQEEFGYGSVCCFVAASALAAAWASQEADGAGGGITGFQAGCVLWEFIRQWSYPTNKCGLQLLDYDKLLYPQYADRFNPIIDDEVAELLQKEAQRLLDTEDLNLVHPDVEQHWREIANGNFPIAVKKEN